MQVITCPNILSIIFLSGFVFGFYLLSSDRTGLIAATSKIVTRDA
jgi:hypothetical protein